MNGKQLKNSILQWAIQGKLVSQDPNDEPASVLLEKIRGEKERLIKEKKIKRDKNASIIYRGEDNSYYEKMLATGEVKCIDEEVPFDIPQGWEWCRFSSLYLSLTDGTHSTPKYTLTGIPFISVKDISSGIIDFSNTKYISKEEHQKLSDRCHPQKGDLLLSKVGTTGIPALVTTDKEFSLFVSVALIKLTQNKFSNEFLVFMIQSPLVQEQAKENTRGVGNKNWVLSAIAKTLMVVPPFEEQKRIKNRLNLILPYIEKYSSSQDKLDLLNVNIVTDLKKSILQEAIQGKLVPQIAEEGTAQELLEQIKTEKQKLFKEGKLKKSALNESVIFRGDDNKYWENIGKSVACIDDDIPFEIPPTWIWCRLGDCVKIIGGYAFKSYELKSPVGYRVIRISDISENGLVNNNIVKYNGNEDLGQYLIKENDILIAKTGGTVGKSLLLNNALSEPFLLNQRVAIIRNFWINVEYLNAFLHSPYIKQIIDKKKNSTNDNISMADLNGFLLPLPPLKEQQRIVERYKNVTSIMSK